MIFEKKKPVFDHACSHLKMSLATLQDTGAEDFSNPWDRLAAEIVMAAIRDWRTLVKRKAWRSKHVGKCNFDEIRIFFRSSYCEFIMQNFSMPPEAILSLLESELREAMEKDDWKGEEE